MEQEPTTVSGFNNRKMNRRNQPRLLQAGLIFLVQVPCLELSLPRLEKMIFKNKIQLI